jgi:hypothetical protein
MAPVVDRFVIVESWETHSGLAKKERLWKDVHAHVFEPYADKIEWMILETLGPTQEGVPLPSEEIWKREKLQRDAPTEWLRRQAGPWLALICDSDEIVNPDAIKQAKMEPSSFEMPCSLRMDFFYYNFHWVKPGKWYAPYVISDKGVDTHIAKSDATLSIIRDPMAYAQKGWQRARDRRCRLARQLLCIDRRHPAQTRLVCTPRMQSAAVHVLGAYCKMHREWCGPV